MHAWLALLHIFSPLFAPSKISLNKAKDSYSSQSFCFCFLSTGITDTPPRPCGGAGWGGKPGDFAKHPLPGCTRFLSKFLPSAWIQGTGDNLGPQGTVSPSQKPRTQRPKLTSLRFSISSFNGNIFPEAWSSRGD